MNMDPTCINRTSNSERGKQYQDSSEVAGGNIRPFGEYVQFKQEAVFKHTAKAHINDPLRESTLRYNTPLLLNL